MKKVVLFNPQSEFYAMPLGLLAVGSALDPASYDVRIIDARIQPQAIDKTMEDARDAVCVGMTVFSGEPIGQALRVTRELKRRYPSLPIIWGGWHPSILPEQCIESGVIDAVVIGQGEWAFRELMSTISDPSRWSSIPGLCISVDGKPQRTAARPLARMEQLEPVRYELLDVARYFRSKGKLQLDFSSSRGCPYRCTFCADPMVYRNKWTGLPAERVLSELMALHDRYKMDEVFFLDDDLFASLKRIQALADAFISASIPFIWKGTARADELCRLPESFFPRLRSSGCVRINIGAESASQKVLDRIKKDYESEQIRTAARRASKAGIAISFSFITGFPGETEEDFQVTLDMVHALRRMDSRMEASIYFYSPYPGTELARELEVQQGLRLPSRLEDWEKFNIEGAWLPRNDPRFITRVRNLDFYLKHGYAKDARTTSRRVLNGIARFRCARNWYGFPVERYLVEAWRSWKNPVART